MKYYYTDAQNKPAGPVELEQLKQLAAQGAITAQSYVIPEGATQWVGYATFLASLQPAPAVPAPAAPAATTTQPAPVAPVAAQPAQPVTPAAQPAAASPAPKATTPPADQPAPAPAVQPAPAPAAEVPQPSAAKPTPAARPTPAAVSTPTPEVKPAVAAPVPAPANPPAAASTPPPQKPEKPTPAPQPVPAPVVAPAPKASEPAGPQVGIVEQVSTLLASFIDLLLQGMRSLLTENLLRTLLTVFARGGYILVLVGAALGLVQSLVGGIRSGSFGGFVAALGSGLVVAGAVAVLQYVAFRFFSANEALVKNNPSRVGSAAFLDCLALVLLVGAFAAAVGAVFGSIAAVSFVPLIPGLLSAAVLLFGAGIALNPKLCNVEIQEASAGEEAIGIASFFGKAALVAQPLFFALLALGGTLAICVSFFNASAGESIAATLRSVPIAGALAAAGSAALLVIACLLPFFYYLGFLVLYLHLDLLRAILGLPRKLDRLAR